MADEIIDAAGTQGSGERPTFLTVLCILTWVGSGLGIIGAFTGDSASASPLWYQMILLVANILTAYGAYAMWNLQKTGLYVYTAGEVIALILPFILIYAILPSFAANLMGSMMIVYAIFPIAFLIMYWLNAKHLQ